MQVSTVLAKIICTILLFVVSYDGVHSLKNTPTWTPRLHSALSVMTTPRSEQTLALGRVILALVTPFTAFSESALALDPLPPVPAALKMLPAPEAQSSVVKLPDGVEYYDVKMGDMDGPTVQDGNSVQFLWVLRRANGYFVSSSATENDNNPFIYRAGNRDRVITGLDEGIRGMRVGGIRRISVPAAVAYVKGVEGDVPGPVPQDFGPKRQIQTRNPLNEVWKFEVKVTKIKQ